MGEYLKSKLLSGHSLISLFLVCFLVIILCIITMTMLNLLSPTEHFTLTSILNIGPDAPIISYPLSISESEKRYKRIGMIYVLGGMQDNLKIKYKAAARIYQKGLTKKIYILSVPGITEYDPVLQRNLTNDEWSTKQLAYLGVPPYDIEFIHTPKCYFGTLSEAMALKKITKERSVQQVLLICSSYHANRVQITFTTVLKKTGVKVEINQVQDECTLEGFIIELIKLTFYKNILLPYNSMMCKYLGEHSCYCYVSDKTTML
jgi:hypothetical protein